MNNFNVASILKYAGGVLLAIGLINPILNQYGYTIRSVPVISWPVGIGMAVAGAAMIYFGWKMEKDKAATK